MADDSASVSQGVDAGPATLSEEALESFEVFEEEEHFSDYQIRHERFRNKHTDFDQNLAASDILGSVPERDVYDDFGDSFPDSYDDDPHDAGSSGEDLPDFDLKEHYDHLYLGDYQHRNRDRDERVQQMWQEEVHQEGERQTQEWVFIDAHILTTPAIADIDQDGHEDLVVAVSYFFDREYYEQVEHAQELKGIDVGKYVASGVVVFDLRTRRIKWEQHLDLSTDATSFKAYAYAAPTLIDLEQDGFLEIVMGTSMGFLYVLDHDGSPREGWPIQMGDIQGQALVLDINNDGLLEVVAADTRGNVVALNTKGEEIWTRHVHSLIAQGVTAGDVNGDGDIELVWGTGSGHVYAVRGVDGLDINNFPFKTRGRIHAPVLLTRLTDGPSLHAVVPSFDGFLYLIDGLTACADTVDVGESSYSMVLADDLDGNGRMELVLSTMNGNIYVLETPSDYHPLKTWTAQVMGPNLMLARHDYLGVYASLSSRQPRDVAGEKLQIKVVILDKRGLMLPGGKMVQTQGGPYNISVVLKGVGVREMNSGPTPIIGVVDTFSAPGTYLMELPCPRTRTTATVHIEMVDSHGMVLSDEFALSFHLHFHKLLKWLVAGPPLLMALAVVVVSAAARRRAEEEEQDGTGPSGGRTQTKLPSFHPHLG